MPPNLILGSGSPYRKRLMERLRIPFSVAVPPLHEESHKIVGEDPAKQALRLSQLKAQSLETSHSQDLIIGSDQLISLNGEILGKSHTPQKAREQLQKMCGQTHEILTAVTLVYQGRAWSHLDETRMTMFALSDSEIETYVKLDTPLDCAGSYKFEKAGVSLFSRVRTEDPSAIEGLPLLWLVGELRNLGFSVPQF